MRVVATAVIEQEDVEKLQKAHMERSGMLSLLNEKQFPTDRDYEVFSQKHDAYQRAWNAVLTKYFDGKYQVGNFNWNCDFVTREVTISG